MNDIVERLFNSSCGVCAEAYYEIKRLRGDAQELEAELRKSSYSEGELQAEIEQLRALLDPFLRVAADEGAAT